MNHRKKEYIKGVLDEYRKLPDINILNKKLYEDLNTMLNRSNCTNGEVMNTMKLILIQMAEQMMDIVGECDEHIPTNTKFTDEELERYK